MHSERIARVARNLQEMGLSQALVSDPLSIFYLTGYYTQPYERFFALLLRLTDGGVRTTLFCNCLFPDATGAADELVTFSDTDNPVPMVVAACDNAAPLGVDKTLEARWLVPLMNAQAGTCVRLSSAAVDEARSQKDARERELMREASRINDEGMAWLARQVAQDVTEQTIAEQLLDTYRSLGAQDLAFSPIVSFGANAADPHHEPDGTAFTLGDMVLFDVGCKLDSYCSDMTRTFFTAQPTVHQLNVYDTVRRANEAAEAIVRPGVLFSELDRTAREVIEDAGFGPYFTHRLGHQIGMQEHEPGDVSASHHEPVRPGQVFSIEPGIYLPGDIGVRIEDLVLVTEDGCEILNRFTHEPTVLEV